MRPSSRQSHGCSPREPYSHSAHSYQADNLSIRVVHLPMPTTTTTTTATSTTTNSWALLIGLLASRPTNLQSSRAKQPSTTSLREQLRGIGGVQSSGRPMRRCLPRWCQVLLDRVQTTGSTNRHSTWSRRRVHYSTQKLLLNHLICFYFFVTTSYKCFSLTYFYLHFLLLYCYIYSILC